MELFGFEFKRKVTPDKEPQSFVPPNNSEDGAVVVSAGGAYGTYVDLDGTIRTEAELVSRYREMSLQPECDSAIDEIVNESITIITEEDIVKINLDSIDLSPQLKKTITAEFNHCLRLIEFDKYAYEIYRRWYIDGRLYYHVIIDEKNTAAGIKELRYIDPRKIRKIREIQKKRSKDAPSEVILTKTVNEYFIYNDKGFNVGNRSISTNSTGLKIAKDSIIHVVSGLTDNQGSMVLSHLHRSIKPLNQLRTLEDALVIYRLARAPERRIWYIDVGNLPKMKAEQYVRDIMVKHKNRLIYDAQSGEIRDDRKFMTMLEDYWLPRREGGRGTEVTTLPGGQNLGQMDDVLYFQKKFLQSLGVPVSRLNSDALFSIGRATEITRDELKFDKFIVRLRARFTHLFLKMLEKQLVLKGITTIEDWQNLQTQIKFDFAKDNYFAELKEAEIRQGRTIQARELQDVAGKYISHRWVRKNVLRQSDEEIELEDSLIFAENNTGDPRWVNPVILQNAQMVHDTAAAQAAEDGSVGGGGPEREENKYEMVRQAKIFVKQMKERGVENRTPQEQSKYKQAVQYIAKNPEIAKSLGGDS